MDLAELEGDEATGADVCQEYKVVAPLTKSRRMGKGSVLHGGTVADVGHLYAFGNTEGRYRIKILGCKGAYEAFLQSWDTAHADALKSHSQAIAKKNVLMETVQKDLDTKLAKALRFPKVQEAVRKQVFAMWAEQIRSAEDAVAASQQLVTDTGRMCGASTVSLASLPSIYPLTGTDSGILTPLPIVEPLD